MVKIIYNMASKPRNLETKKPNTKKPKNPTPQHTDFPRTQKSEAARNPTRRSN